MEIRVSRLLLSLSLLIAFSLLVPRLAAAQTIARDSQPRITTVTLRRNGIFDHSDSSWVAHLVNSLHVTTRAPLIRREFLFRPGDRYDSARVAETERNLRQLGVFRGVEIDSTRSDSGIALQITTHDGWTTRPDFRFRSTGGSVAYTLALIEDNLLGTLTQAQVLYQHDPDRSTTVLGLSRRRLIAGRINGAIAFHDRSDGQLFFAQLALPYFATFDRTGGALTFDDRRDRIFRYRDGVPVPRDTLQNRYLLVRADFSQAMHASSYGYLRGGFTAQLRRDDYVSDAAYQVEGFPTKSITGAVGMFIESRHVHIVKDTGFQSFNREEDIDLSPVVRASLFVAPSVFGYRQRNEGLAPGVTAHIGTRFPAGFAYADLSASGLYTSYGLDSGQVALSGLVAIVPSIRHQLVLHGEVGALKNPLFGTEFDLGLGAGPRAFTQHSFTGNREFFVTAEYRYTVSPELFKVVGLGLAAFVDHGGAWWSDEPRRTGWDYGVGLRLGASRAPELELNRIDFAWRAAMPGVPGGWVLAIGKGFAFAAGPRGTSR